MTRQTLNQVRSTIVGVGGFGLHAIGHFAPRLRFLNNQRRLVDPTLPDLDRLVSYAAIVPRRPTNDREGALELWLPIRQNLSDIDPMAMQRFWRAVERFTHDLITSAAPETAPDEERQTLDAALADWQATNPKSGPDVFLAEVINDALIRYLAPRFRVVATSPIVGSPGDEPLTEGDVRLGRSDILDSLMASANPFGTQLEYQLSLAYQDLVQPIEDQTQVTMYVIGSVCDDWSSALFWPLGHLLRRRLQDYEVEIVGLISTGPYSPPPYRAYEEAAAFAGLYEYDFLGQATVQELADTPYVKWPLLRDSIGCPAFDRCYLLDAVKASRATAGNEREAVISIANALELFIAGNGDLIIQEQLAAGLSLNLRATYSALGSAVKFLPIQKIQYWVINSLSAEIARDHLLPDSEKDEKRLSDAHERGRRYAETQGLTLEGVGRALVPSVGVPIVPRSDGSGQTLPTYRLRDDTLLLPPALRAQGARQRRTRLLPWYGAVNRYREELVRIESTSALIQELSNETADRDYGDVSRWLGRWRLQMAIEAGTVNEVVVSDIREARPGLTLAQYGNRTVWLGATTGSLNEGNQGNAQLIPYADEYLGLLVSDERQATREVYQRVQLREERDRNKATTWMGRTRVALVDQLTNEMIGDNKGLPLSHAWLRGVLSVVNEQIERLPHNVRAEHAFQDGWTQRHIALEQSLGGRPEETEIQPGREGRPRTRGLAQRQPEPAGLAARAFIAAMTLLFLVFGYLRRSQAFALDGLQTVALAATILIASTLPAVLLWGVHRLQDERFRRRTMTLFAEQLDHYVSHTVVDTAAEALRRSHTIIAAMLDTISRDISMGESWRDESLARHDLSIDDLSDTILRQAIGEMELIEKVGQLNRQDRDKLLREIDRKKSNLWRWPNPPADRHVRDALGRYADAAEQLVAWPEGSQAAGESAQSEEPKSSSRRNRRRRRPAEARVTRAPTPPQAQIWSWMQENILSLTKEFVDREIPYNENIETYIAKHPRIVNPMAGEDMIGGEGQTFNPHEYLIDMGYLAKPYIFLDEAELSEPIVSINLLGVDREERTRFDRTFIADLRPDARWSTHPPRLVTTRDPFSITYLRTLHGLAPRTMSRWQRYRDAFAHLADGDRRLLQALSSYEVEPDPDNPSLFFTEALDVGEEDSSSADETSVEGESDSA